MNSLKASLRLWLRLQCQSLTHVTLAHLVKVVGDQRLCLAQWPDTVNTPSIELNTLITEVTLKQRVHLTRVDEDHFLLGHPININGKYWGAMVMNVAGKKDDLPAILKSIQNGLVWLQFLLHEMGKSARTTTAARVTQLPQLLTDLLSERTLAETSITLVNRLATQLDCVRVSLGLSNANHIQLEAISASASFDKRTEAMQLLAEAMNEASDQHRDITYCTEGVSAGHGAVTRCHQQLLQYQRLGSVHSFLLRKDDRIIGVMTFEKTSHTSFSKDEQAFIRLAVLLLVNILAIKKRATESLWQSVKYRWIVHSHYWLGKQRHRTKLLLTATAIALLVLSIPVAHQVNSDASLESASKHLLIAPQDGYLSAIYVHPGDKVIRGDVLAQLADEELRLENRKLLSQRQQHQQEYDNALANSNRVAAAIAAAQLDQANIHLQLIEQQLQRTRLTAPIDGMIISDDITQTRGAPIKQGEVLIEIAATEGYVVQLFVDERDIAMVQLGQAGQIKLASLPNEFFNFHIKKITPLSEIRDGRNFFRVEAELIQESEILRSGMSGSAKITVGKRSLGWIWFHDVWHWLRLTLWW